MRFQAKIWPKKMRLITVRSVHLNEERREMESLKDKVVVVTGGGSGMLSKSSSHYTSVLKHDHNISLGIGRATCIKLAKHGAKVVLSDINLEEAQQTVKLILSEYPFTLQIFSYYLLPWRYTGANALALRCDVSSASSVSSMIEYAVEKFGRIDLAVNNGIDYFHLLLVLYSLFCLPTKLIQQ